MSATSDVQDVFASARNEAVRMRAAIDRLAPDGIVRLQRDQFAKLAALIETLAAHSVAADRDCFHAAVDGIRWWVPLPEVERDRAELARLRSRQRAADVEAWLARATS